MQSQVGANSSSIPTLGPRSSSGNSASRLSNTVNSKPVVPPSTSKIPVPLLAANGVGRRGKTDVDERSKGIERDGEDDQSVASGGSTSWAAKKGAKKNIAAKSQSQSQSDHNGDSAPFHNSDDGSEDDPKLSTGSFKTDIATKGGPSFNVDDWQPDFNGSQSTASVATSLKRENIYCVISYIVLYCVVLHLLYCIVFFILSYSILILILLLLFTNFIFLFFSSLGNAAATKDRDDGFGTSSKSVVWGASDNFSDSQSKSKMSPNTVKASPNLQKMADVKHGNKNDVKDSVSTSLSTSSSATTNATDETHNALLLEIKELKNENSQLKNENGKIHLNNNSKLDDEKIIEINSLKNRIKQLNGELSKSNTLLHEVTIDRDEKSNENIKLLKELLDFKMSAVPQIDESNRLKKESSELKVNLQLYAAKLTSMEVELAEMQVAYLSPNRRLSGGYESQQPPIPGQLPTSTSTSNVISSSILKPSLQKQKEKEKEKEYSNYENSHEIQKEKQNEISKSPAVTSSGSKFSNFVNSTKKPIESAGSGSGSAPQGSGYVGGKRVPSSQYASGSLDLS